MGLIADFVKAIDDLAHSNFHKQKYRVFVPTPPHTETVHLDPIRESDTYGGWRKWMEDCKGCDDKKLKEWLDGIIKPYHESVYNCIDAAKKNLESKDTTVKTKDEYKKGILAKIDKDEQADLDAMNKKYDDQIAAQDEIIDDSNAKKSTVGSVYKEEEEKEKVKKAEEKKAEIEEDRADEEEDIKEKYQDQRDDADDKAEDMVEDAEERKEKIEDQIKEIDDFKKDHSDITAGKGDLKPIFEFKHTSKFAEQIYSGYVPLVDKYSGKLSPDLYTGSQIVVDTTPENASFGDEQTTESTEQMTEEAWRFAYKHDKKHHDREITKWEWESETQQGVVGYDFNEETGEETEVMGDVQVRVLKSKTEKIECPPWCEENDLEIRPAQDVKVSYSEKKGNRFSYKVKQQADKDSEYYQYFWFINDNATDSLAYRSDISIQRAGLSKASTVNDAGKAGGEESSVADDPFVKLVNAIPSIKVVEFQPVLNIAELVNNVVSIFGMGAALGEAAADLLSGGKDKRIEQATYEFFNRCTSFGKGSLINNICDEFGQSRFGTPSAEFVGLFDFPYIMYKHALRYTVLNTYEFPYFGNNYMVGRGSQGWHDSTLANILPGAVSDVAKYLNVNITTRPMFSLDGNGEPYPAVEFELNLFNYNLQALVHNFLFINTLVPNNMWLQRGMFQQGSCLYDIQIPGRIRFFCCKADISVEHAGITRVPPKEFFDQLDLHIGKMEDEYTVSRDKYDAIRVPDVYKVKISFQSLIPNNYNTYLFTYFESDRIEENTELDIEKDNIQDSAVDALSKGVQRTFDETIKATSEYIEKQETLTKKYEQSGMTKEDAQAQAKIDTANDKPDFITEN